MKRRCRARQRLHNAPLGADGLPERPVIRLPEPPPRPRPPQVLPPLPLPYQGGHQTDTVQEAQTKEGTSLLCLGVARSWYPKGWCQRSPLGASAGGQECRVRSPASGATRIRTPILWHQDSVALPPSHCYGRRWPGSGAPSCGPPPAGTRRQGNDMWAALTQPLALCGELFARCEGPHSVLMVGRGYVWFGAFAFQRLPGLQQNGGCEERYSLRNGPLALLSSSNRPSGNTLRAAGQLAPDSESACQARTPGRVPHRWKICTPLCPTTGLSKHGGFFFFRIIGVITVWEALG